MERFLPGRRLHDLYGPMAWLIIDREIQNQFEFAIDSSVVTGSLDFFSGTISNPNLHGNYCGDLAVLSILQHDLHRM